MFLSQMLEEYKESDNKQEILNKFLDLLWGSKITYKRYKKYYTYKVYDELLDNREDLIKLFNNYKSIEYTVCKSSYHKNKLDFVDYIRIHINNMYGYLFDDKVYYKSHHYKLLLFPKKEYMRIIKIKKEKGSINEINCNDVENRIKNALIEAENIKNESMIKKYKMKWGKYKKLINLYIVRLFNNYISVEDYEKKNGWSMNVSVDGWCEDNYVIKYFCKSLTGYMKNYIRDNKVQKKCLICNKNIPRRNKYCNDCYIKYRRIYKTKKQQQYRNHVDN